MNGTPKPLPPITAHEASLMLTKAALHGAIASMSRLVLALEAGRPHGVGLPEAQAMLQELGPDAEALFGRVLPTWVAIAQAEVASLPMGRAGQA